jgi:hypothetical protein
MTIPQFIRFYQGYTINNVMSEFALVFYTLVNAMNRIKANEQIDDITSVRIANAERPEEHVRKLQEQSKGLSGLIDQAKIIRGLK